MNIEAKDGKIIVAAHHSGRDTLIEGRGLAAVSLILAMFVILASLGILFAVGMPAADLLTWATLQPFVASAGMILATGAIWLVGSAIAAPFDTGFEFVFDPASKTCTYKRILRLRRWGIDLRRAPETFAFSEISGIGVREISEAGSYLYAPILFIGHREISLATGSGSYLGLEPKLDWLRQATGLRKHDRGGSALYQVQSEATSQ